MSKRLRNSFLLSVTLSDFMLTLFFLLLLLSSYSLLRKNQEIGILKEGRKEDKERIAELTDDLRQLEERVEVIRYISEKLGDGDDRELQRLILVTLRDATRLKELENTNRALDRERATLKDQVSVLESKVASLTRYEGSSCATQLATSERERDELTGQLRFCSDRLAKIGFGKKPCWVDPAGRIEYIFAVTITEDVIKVAPSWPPRRAEAAQQVSGASALAGTWSTAEFGLRAAPLLAWSDQNDCRHYVTIEDQAVSKAAFKRNLLTVEGYFYKRLLSDGERHPASPAARATEADLPVTSTSSQSDASSGM